MQIINDRMQPEHAGLIDNNFVCNHVALQFLISLDPTFTAENVANVMKKVVLGKRKQVWMRILRWEARSYVENVYSGSSTEMNRILACSNTYVHCCPESSWEDLTSLLYEQDEATAVDQAEPFLPPRGKLTLVSISQYN